MMQLAQLEEVLCHKEHRKPKPHPMQQFLKVRFIKPENASRFIEMSSATVYNWLSGRAIPPVKGEQKLAELKASILRWEAKHGKMFDGRLYEK